ncbi:MAG: J domain-containing protein [Desulfovibrionaceae bacterium]|nr:J domain-containing protein [Desulfovibrionaceae bacterium]
MAVQYKDYYKLLGVDKNSSDEVIAKAFKKLARKYHPDLNPNNKEAEEHFKEINEAYEVLKDPEKRRLYDQLGPNWQNAQHQGFGGQGFGGTHFTFDGKGFDGAGFSDFFETLFGDKARGGFGGGRGGFGADPFGSFSQRPRRGRDVETELFLSLEEVAKGGSRKVTVNTPNGPKQLDIRVPAGIEEGKKLRLQGQGTPMPGGTAGDLFLKIRYKPHDRFKVEGRDLICDLPITPWEAVLGTKASVKTLDGEVEINVPAGTSSGRKFRLRGKGLGSGNNRGDILLQAMIKVPATLKDEEKVLWDKLAALSSYRAR